MLAARRDLPPPSKVVADTWELIVNPLYDNGGNDKGLFWHLFASLKRVATGYLLAACCGIALGVLIGSSKWAMRALDPLFQVLRTIAAGVAAAVAGGVPRRSALGHLRDIHHRHLAHHHQYRGGRAQHPAGLPKCPLSVLRLNGAEFFIKIMLPAAAPYIFTGLRIGGTFPRRHRRRGNADRRRRHRLLHLGCVEQLAHQRHHPGAGFMSRSSVSCWTG